MGAGGENHVPTSGPALLASCGLAAFFSLGILIHGIVLHRSRYRTPRVFTDVIAVATLVAAALIVTGLLLDSKSKSAHRSLILHLLVQGFCYFMVQSANVFFILPRALAVNTQLDGIRLSILLLLLVATVLTGGPLTIAHDMALLGIISMKLTRLRLTQLSFSLSYHIWILGEMIVGYCANAPTRKVTPTGNTTRSSSGGKRRSGTVRNLQQNFERSFAMATCSLVGCVAKVTAVYYDYETLATLFYFVTVLLPTHICFNSPMAQRLRRVVRGYTMGTMTLKKTMGGSGTGGKTTTTRRSKGGGSPRDGKESPPGTIGGGKKSTQRSTGKGGSNSTVIFVTPAAPPGAGDGGGDDGGREGMRLEEELEGNDSPRNIVDEDAPATKRTAVPPSAVAAGGVTGPMPIEGVNGVVAPQRTMLLTVQPIRQYATGVFLRTMESLEHTIKIHVSPIVFGQQPSFDTTEYLDDGEEDEDAYFDPEDGEEGDDGDGDGDDDDDGLDYVEERKGGDRATALPGVGIGAAKIPIPPI